MEWARLEAKAARKSGHTVETKQPAPVDTQGSTEHPKSMKEGVVHDAGPNGQGLRGSEGTTKHGASH
jgi:hypothetical protein